MPKLVSCLIHRDAKPGKLLQYADGRQHYVAKDGARINVVASPNGEMVRPLKLTKKQRRKLRPKHE